MLLGIANNVPVEQEVGYKVLSLNEVQFFLEASSQLGVVGSPRIALGQCVFAEHSKQGLVLAGSTSVAGLVLVSGSAPLVVGPVWQIGQKAFGLTPNPGLKALLGAFCGFPPGVPLFDDFVQGQVGKGSVAVHGTEYSVEFWIFGAHKDASLPCQGPACLRVALSSKLLVVCGA